QPQLKVTRIGSLPRAFSKAAAVALPHGRLMVLGGYTGAGSLDTILAGPPSRLRVVGHLPQPTHDAAAAAVGGSVYLFGGGESVSMPSVVRIDPRTGSATEAPALGEPLSDLGAAAIAGRAYLVGGYTGTQFATAILRYRPQGAAAVVARLPTGTRYAGVAALGPTIYVAGGLTTAGATSAVYAVSPAGTVRRVAALPAPEDHAALAALDGELYLAGGRRVLALDPGSGKVSVVARLPATLSDPTATTVGNRIVIAGGGTNGVWALSAR
ncbi:MAG TPA: hypothetical protein VFU33_01255, partial [Gaiellaceae bacterium]|nr:hypothetical protein [Gaiellaceae bacterium]